MNKETRTSYLAFVSSMLIFGTLGIFRRYIPLSSCLLVFSRGLLGSLTLLLFVRLRGGRLQRLAGRTLLALIVTGAIIGLNWLLLFESYGRTTVATATMCYYMQPTIVILLSPLVFQERLTARRLLCALAAIVGMVFVSGVLDSGGARSGDLSGILFGLGAAVLYATVVILNKKVVLDDVYEKTIVQLAAAAAVLIPYLLATEDLSRLSLDAVAVVMVLLVGIVHTGFAYALYFGSMKALKAQSIAVLSYIDPVFALLLSAAVLHEPLSAFGLVGAVLIIGSALISETAGKREH